jgi:eukaryotic-like serine/threonine-protein kinase
MPIRIEPHEEPIPGYRLIERLGSGGFGEVWKAEAPGGLFKAIKFVQCEVSSEDSAIGNDQDRSRADQELKSLSRVKSVHHPYVISLDRFEIVEDYLVIVMELADRTLADRFKQCRGQGLPGVPREELLGYLREAAEALDLMNSQYQLQHLDIKPQNLFLVHNHIKVADFGLVKDISDQKFMTITGGVTPVYAAPETFDGKFSRQSDQYSLAIVYQEMLTGHRPFTGTSMKQLILQHLQNSHDLTPVPVHDRPVMAKALSKNPEDRYATCIDFVQYLQKATMKGGGSATPASAPMVPVGDRPFPSMSKTEATRGGAGPVKPAEPNFSAGKPFLRDASTSASRPARPAHAVPAEDALTKTAATPRHGECRPKPTPPTGHEPAGLVQPALVIGIGQLGVDTLAQLRRRIATELGSGDAVPHVRLIAIDTDAGSLQNATVNPEPGFLRPQETLHARLLRPSHYLKTRDGKLPTDCWLNAKLLYRIPREQTSASVRALGRLAFIDNYRVIARRLEAELHACISQDTPHDADPSCDLGLRSTKPRVYLITSLTGSTGSGMFLDVAYLVRRLLCDQGHADAEIVGMFYLPAASRDSSHAPALANAYASLVELQHFCKPNATFSAFYETAANVGKGERVTASGPALQRCVLFSLPAHQRKLDPGENIPVIAQAGDLLFRELATQLGQAIDEARAGMNARDESERTGPRLQSMGAYQVVWPRHALLEQASRHLCSQLVMRWLNKDAAPVADTIRQWTLERWESLGLRPETLIERFQQLAEEAMQQKPEHLLAEVLAPVQELAAAKAGKSSSVNMMPIVQTMDRLEHVLGSPDDGRGPKPMNAEPALLERTLAEIAHALADDCEQQLAELAVALLEDPFYRLAGAEEALRQFSTTVDQALQSQDALARELAEKAAQLHQRIHQVTDKPIPVGSGSSAQRAITMSHRPSGVNLSGADLFELVRTYTKTRYHSLVLGHLNRLYLGLRGHLSDQIREVGFCRQRLGELHDLLKPLPPKFKHEPARTDLRVLFPPGSLELKDAVAQLSETIGPDDLLRFDEIVQNWVTNHCQALLQICMGASSLVKSLAPAMLQEAENFLGDRLQGTSVAEMYLARHRGQDAEDDAGLLDDLQRCLDEATPEFGRIAHDHLITLVTLPNDEHGAQLKKLVQKQSKHAKVLLTNRLDEMVFYQEIDDIQWKDVEQLGPIALENYQQRCTVDPSSVHSREDVFDWQIIAECRR